MTQYGRNLVESIGNLPTTSPLRRPLLQMVAHDIRVSHVAADFGVTPRTVYTAMQEEENLVQSMVSRPGVKRCRIEEDQIELATQFLDEAAPIPSGRTYRLVRVTYENLYAMYRAFCEDRRADPLGKTYFIDKILHATNVRHSGDDTICKLCDKKKKWQVPFPLSKKDQEQYDELVDHVETWHQQGQYYLQKKNLLITERRQNVVMIIQDFTQILVQSTFYQDLIIVFYKFDANAVGNLHRRYNHFVAPTSDTSNDGNFVARCWKHLLDHGMLTPFDEIHILSDGGGKHFKTTAMMNFFGILQMASGKKIEYNFFERYHGHSVCDAAAAHAKNALNVYQRDTGVPVNTPQQIINIINNVQNHVAIVAPTVKTDVLPPFKTMNGITSRHKFTFDHKTIFGRKLSKDQQENLTFPMANSQYFGTFLAGL